MSCIICKSSDRKKVLRNLVQCEGCGLIYYAKNLQDSALENLYQKSYFSGDEYFDYKNDKSIIQKNFSYRLKDICKYVDTGNLFEIGCAYGYFLDLARKHFSVSGIDIAKEPVEFAFENLKLDAHTGDYLTSRVNKKDVFCMWDTIEHLKTPEKVIKKIHSDLNSGGYLFITTGDIGSLLAKLMGSRWRLIHPPTHLFYFSKKTITKLLNDSGFEVINISHPGIFRSLKQIIYSLFFLKKKGTSIDKINFLKKFDIPIYLNTFDIMMVVAKKI